LLFLCGRKISRYTETARTIRYLPGPPACDVGGHWGMLATGRGLESCRPRTFLRSQKKSRRCYAPAAALYALHPHGRSHRDWFDPIRAKLKNALLATTN